MTFENTNTSEMLNRFPENMRSDPFIEIVVELEAVKSHPRSLVLITSGFIEMGVQLLVLHHLKNAKKIKNDSRSYPLSTKLLILNELNIISDEWYRVFDWFRKLRNRAAHDAIFTLHPKDFEKIKRDEQVPDPAINFHGFCFAIVAGLFNRHNDVFAASFVPSFVNKQ
jgi:hypothetical protein